MDRGPVYERADQVYSPVTVAVDPQTWLLPWKRHIELVVAVARAAVLVIQVEGENKWLTLIQNASQKKLNNNLDRAEITCRFGFRIRVKGTKKR
jgi:hypothetical protein